MLEFLQTSATSQFLLSVLAVTVLGRRPSKDAAAALLSIPAMARAINPLAFCAKLAVVRLVVDVCFAAGHWVIHRPVLFHSKAVQHRYHHEHRHSWLLEALQCTLRIVQGGGAPERCTPNEPLLALDAAGCVEEASATDAMMDAVPAPGSGTSVVARLRASDSQACCALCNAAAECTSWAFAFDYPMNVINCQLLAKFGAARHEKGHMIGHRRYAPRPKGARVGARDARVAYVPPAAAYE